MGTDLVAVIGLECHAQLRTASKLFCPCPVEAGRDAAGEGDGEELPPNSAICPICLGHPGTLPMPNEAAMRLAVRAAVALGCTVHPRSVFARKHYFYPDLPKGYQITQAERPLATGGAVHVPGADGFGRSIGLLRLHVEEDAGRLHHGPDGTRVDWNRAGVPLVEVVSEPSVRTPEEAEGYLRWLHRVLVEAGVCRGDLERGHFRCDANVSLHVPGAPLGARVEIKNVNSFRFVRMALAYEIARQAAVLEAGGTVVSETRTWAGDRTVALRRKEAAADYRYLADPDLPPLVVPAAWIADARATLAGVPLDRALQAADAARRNTWVARYGLDAAEVDALLAEEAVAAFFVAAVAAGGAPRAMATWVRGEVQRRRNAGTLGALAPRHVVAVQRLLDAGTVNREAARGLLDEVARTGGDPAAIAADRGLSQLSDATALDAVIATVLVGFPGELARYRAGDKGLFGFFMGQLMAATGRRADPALGARRLREALDAPARDGAVG
ncbi:MAG: Asp-tRNA(Asn)/Glu-tRNA(Gln) amidotransferase subunit GatB [Pseudomonadota bacterium]|nr:Asp-tRNA(Asn)/Glu-tRNA(Gln) amidotransferase subunit GatB [Pseudomonadota bacterium]